MHAENKTGTVGSNLQNEPNSDIAAICSRCSILNERNQHHRARLCGEPAVTTYPDNIRAGTGDLQTVRALLGHVQIESTARYLGLKPRPTQ
jgi:hypothetical protein